MASAAAGTRAFCESFAKDGKERKERKDVFAAAAEDASRRGTPVFVAFDGELVGVLEMEDEIRDDARLTVARLKRRGVRVVLLSGDRKPPPAPSAARWAWTRRMLWAPSRPRAKPLRSPSSNPAARASPWLATA